MFTYAVKVDIGVSAKNNDDRVLIGKELVVEGEISGSCCKSYISSAVFDGVGGMAMGYKAAETAAEYLKILDKESVSAFDIRKCIEEANIKIRTMQTVENIPKGMRTTIAEFYADEKHMIIYNAGDSRVYRFRYRFFTQLSKEHSLVQQMIDAGQITIEEAKKHSKRNIITKCLGETEIVAPYVIDMGDDFVKEDIIMICSDGIYDNLYDTEIKKILLNGMDKSLLELCCKICCKAIDNGSQDNLSIILIRKEEN